LAPDFGGVACRVFEPARRDRALGLIASKNRPPGRNQQCGGENILGHVIGSIMGRTGLALCFGKT
jgi:hypothetical protein